MFNRKVTYGIILSLAVLAAILACIIFCTRKNDLSIYFLDVGQGDSILISQGSNQLLIDGGKDGKLLLEKLGKYIPFWDRSIETIITTHPDQDHIGGLINVLGAYHVNSVLKTKAQSDSETYKKLESEIAEKGVQEVEVKSGISINFSNGANVKIIYPFESVPEKIDNASNDNSVVAKLAYGENVFLFTGDLPTTKENEIISQGVDIKSGILKVAHHGSKYATGNEFLDAVKPADAIISVGKNSYGHPNPEVLDRLLQHKINILRTDETGDVVYKCANIEAQCIRVVN